MSATLAVAIQATLALAVIVGVAGSIIVMFRRDIGHGLEIVAFTILARLTTRPRPAHYRGHHTGIKHRLAGTR